MGLSDNIVVRYCISVDDGQENLGDGERVRQRVYELSDTTTGNNCRPRHPYTPTSN